MWCCIFAGRVLCWRWTLLSSGLQLWHRNRSLYHEYKQCAMVSEIPGAARRKHSHIQHLPWPPVHVSRWQYLLQDELGSLGVLPHGPCKANPDLSIRVYGRNPSKWVQILKHTDYWNRKIIGNGRGGRQKVCWIRLMKSDCGWNVKRPDGKFRFLGKNANI